MRQILSKLLRKSCEHEHTLIVRSVGVQREVCEGCGFVSFNMIPVNTTTSPSSETLSRTELPRASGL